MILKKLSKAIGIGLTITPLIMVSGCGSDDDNSGGVSSSPQPAEKQTATSAAALKAFFHIVMSSPLSWMRAKRVGSVRWNHRFVLRTVPTCPSTSADNQLRNVGFRARLVSFECRSDAVSKVKCTTINHESNNSHDVRNEPTRRVDVLWPRAQTHMPAATARS